MLWTAPPPTRECHRCEALINWPREVALGWLPSGRKDSEAFTGLDGEKIYFRLAETGNPSTLLVLAKCDPSGEIASRNVVPLFQVTLRIPLLQPQEPV